MKSYVIGANGFLGNHLVSWLEKDGEVMRAPSYDGLASKK